MNEAVYLVVRTSFHWDRKKYNMPEAKGLRKNGCLANLNVTNMYLMQNIFTFLKVCIIFLPNFAKQIAILWKLALDNALSYRRLT